MFPTSRVEPTKRLAVVAALAVCATAYSTSSLAQSHAPIANAGGPYFGTAGSTIFLDASKSYDPDGGSLTYAWDLTGSGLFSDSNSVHPSFSIASMAPLGTQYVVFLKVSNGDKTTISGSSVSVVSSVPEPAGIMLFGIGLMCLGVKSYYGRRPSRA